MDVMYYWGVPLTLSFVIMSLLVKFSILLNHLNDFCRDNFCSLYVSPLKLCMHSTILEEGGGHIDGNTIVTTDVARFYNLARRP